MQALVTMWVCCSAVAAQRHVPRRRRRPPPVHAHGKSVEYKFWHCSHKLCAPQPFPDSRAATAGMEQRACAASAAVASTSSCRRLATSCPSRAVRCSAFLRNGGTAAATATTVKLSPLAAGQRPVPAQAPSGPALPVPAPVAGLAVCLGVAFLAKRALRPHSDEYVLCRDSWPFFSLPACTRAQHCCCCPCSLLPRAMYGLESTSFSSQRQQKGDSFSQGTREPCKRTAPRARHRKSLP